MRFRFSVRTILVAVTVVALGLGWAAHRIRISRQVAMAVSELRGLGAFATFSGGAAPTDQSPVDAVLNLRRIEIVRNVNSDEALAQAATLPHLKQVDISGQVTDKGLANLRKCIGLEELRMTSQKMTDEGLGHVAQLSKSLEVLHVGGTGITDAGMKYIGQLHELKRLKLNDTAISNAGLKELQELTKLDHLDVTNTKATHGGVAHLVMDLQGRGFGDWFPVQPTREDDRVSLWLEGEQFQDDVVPYLVKGLPGLTGLEVVATGITTDGIAELRKCKTLRRLTIRYNVGPVTNIAGIPNLESLRLLGLGDSPPPVIRRMPKLRFLALGNVDAYGKGKGKYQGNGISRLVGLTAESPNLESLSLLNTAADDDDVVQLAALLNQLKELVLGGTKVTDKSLTLLGRSQSLESLHLAWTSVTDVGLRELLPMRQLRNLELRGNSGVTDDGIAELKGLRSLRELNLRRSGVTQSGCDQLREALPHCRIVF